MITWKDLNQYYADVGGEYGRRFQFVDESVSEIHTRNIGYVVGR